MDVLCSADICPVILNSTCVFYEGNNLTYTGITTNDSLQTALQKIDAKFGDASVGYVFTNGLYQPTGGTPVGLGGSLTANTSIGGNFTLTFVGNLQATRHITTGGTASQFVKGDGTLDSTAYQAAGNYITALTGDVIANGPGSVNASLAVVNSNPGTYGSGSLIPVVTVDTKGRVTALTTTAINVPSGILSFVGDVYGSGTTGSPTTLTLSDVNLNVYTNDTFLKFKVNSKGLVTGAAPITGLDIQGALGYTPVPDTRTITINGVTQTLQANRSWTLPGGGSVTYVAVTAGIGISASVTDPATTPNITITNTAPDQVVSIGAGSGISVTGTYPNFTVAATSSGSVTGVTASTPLASSGGSTPNITISQASASVDGYLSSTDWTTFNNKQAALGYTPVPDSRTLTINGTTYDLSADRSWTVASSSSVIVAGTGTNSTVRCGVNNTASGNYSFAGGGNYNTASGYKSFVGGGAGNTASGDYAIIVGGNSQQAAGCKVFIGGGQNNTASVKFATIVGGKINSASGYYSTLSGGYLNAAIGACSFIGGGSINKACGSGSVTSGGRCNTTSGIYAAIVGGSSNQTYGNSSFIGGGSTNSACGVLSVVAGGSNNIASCGYSFVGGGLFNTVTRTGGGALSSCSSIVGGYGNTVSSGYSFIGGGGGAVTFGNTVSGAISSIVGGRSNTVSGAYSVIGGGNFNQVTAGRSAIVGGDSNRVANTNSFIGGGYLNLTCGGNTFIGGGQGNTISGYSDLTSVIAGGNFNTSSGSYTAIVGGCGNTITKGSSFIGGGDCNTASGYFTSVVGGLCNTASGAYSVVVGGNSNSVSGIRSSILGGKSNSVSGNYSAVLGGSNNTITHLKSFIIGDGLTSSAAGTVYVSALSKVSGTFRINHPNPAKTATHYLQHSFVESPTRGDNIYRYKITTCSCSASIELPDYYKFLNENDQIWVSPIGHFGSAYGVIDSCQKTINFTSNLDGEYNVLIIGTRKDIDAMNNFNGVEICKTFK